MNLETVNTVCLGFSSVQSVMVLWIVFGKDEGFWWRRRRIFGEYYGFLAKITDFLFHQCLHCIPMREVPALSMCTHTNEGIPSTEHMQMPHWACADMLMRGNPVTD